MADRISNLCLMIQQNLYVTQVTSFVRQMVSRHFLLEKGGGRAEPHRIIPRFWAQRYGVWGFTEVPGVERSECHQGGGSLQLQWPLLPLGLRRTTGSRKQVSRHKAPVHLRAPGPCLAYQSSQEFQDSYCRLAPTLSGVTPSRKVLARQ